MSALIGFLFSFGFLCLLNVFAVSRNSLVHEIGLQSGVLVKSTAFENVFIHWVKESMSTKSISPWGKDEYVLVCLKHSGSENSLSYFRRKQMLMCCYLTLGYLFLHAVRSASGHHFQMPLFIVGLVANIPLSGWIELSFLKSRVHSRTKRIDQELPSILDLLAFCLAAGEPVVASLQRVSATCSGELAQIFRKADAALACGQSLGDTFRQIRDSSASVALFRTMHSIELALERGTPLAEVLRAQAQEARAIHRQYLITLAGKKEALMMIPVVFFILPMIVFIALFPGLQALHLTQ